MKKSLFLIVCLASLTFLAACAAGGSQSGGDLTGQMWLLDSLSGKALVPGTTITAEFTADGKVAGSAGCNRYTGQYKISGNKIELPTPLATTMMACEQAVMDQETAYLAALSGTQTFEVKGDQLTFKDSGGAVLASYKAQTQDLAGTAWIVTSYNNGKQAVVSAINGTELTAEFGADGTVSGTGGCNTFTGSYKVDGDKITIGPLASTMMFCAEPEGVMDQETQYLAALQSAATYKVQGAELSMRTADDAMAVNFARK